MPPPTPAQLGTVIRQAREAHNLSIETLAEKAGISWRYLSKIERGRKRTNPTWIVLGGIAGALGMEISELAKRAEGLAAGQSTKRS